jgi:hypothetical protein
VVGEWGIVSLAISANANMGSDAAVGVRNVDHIRDKTLTSRLSMYYDVWLWSHFSRLLRPTGSAHALLARATALL